MLWSEFDGNRIYVANEHGSPNKEKAVLLEKTNSSYVIGIWD